MGVRGLNTYITSYCPGGTETVSLANIGQRYYEKHGKHAVLVVDTQVCIPTLYHREIPWIYGGQLIQYLEELRQFVNAFQRAKIDLVFFFDGRVEEKKRSKWVERRLKRRSKIADIFKDVKYTGKEPSDSKLWVPPGNVSDLTKQGLKSLGATVINTCIEADYEIAKYCKEHHCLGILGQDTDFLIFKLDDSEFFSAEKLDIHSESLTTIKYSQQHLCANLGITVYQLPMFACLLGNDFVPHSDLDNFHRYMADVHPHAKRIPYEKLFPSVARYVADNGNRSDRMPTDMDVRYIAENVFHDPRKFGLLKEGITSYDLDDQNYNLSSDTQSVSSVINTSVLESAKRLHINCENGLWILHVMTVAEVYSSTCLEDDMDPVVPSSAIILKPIRHYLYGLIYGIGVAEHDEPREQQDETARRRGLVAGKNAVHEWFVYARNNLKSPDIVEALQLPDLVDSTPSLEQLWLGEGHEVEDLRLKSYLACMHCKISMATINECPTPFLMLCTLLHYIIQQTGQEVICDWELNAFIAQAVSPLVRYADVVALVDMEMPTVIPKAVHLATILMQGVTTAHNVNDACYKPIKREDTLPWHYFDGKLFHKKYSMAKLGASECELCDNNDDYIQLFTVLKRCITEGTRLESGNI